MTNPAVVQACTRCGAYWPVTVTGGRLVPARWCPYCNGGLSVPFEARPPSPQPAPQWPAPAPGRDPRSQQQPPPPPPGPVPPQQAPPQWPPRQSPPRQQQPPPPQQPTQQPPRQRPPSRPVVTGAAARGAMGPGAMGYGGPGYGAAGTGAAIPGAAPPGAPPNARASRGTVLPPGYRWVARTPPADGHAPERPRRRTPAELGPTPRYTEMPRWGLPIGPVYREPASHPARAAADRARFLLNVTMVLLALAAASELVRYVLLLRNRTHLLHRITVAASDSAVLVFGYASMVFVVASAVACALWLVHVRAQAYAAAGEREARDRRRLLAGMLVPVANLVYPGVFLTEAARACGADGRAPAERFAPGLGRGSLGPDDPFRRGPRALAGRVAWRVRQALVRLRRGYRRLRDGTRLEVFVRFWWALWVLANVTAAAVVLQRLGDSLQARADGVLYSAYADVLALAAAAATRILVARMQGAADAAESGRDVERGAPLRHATAGAGAGRGGAGAVDDDDPPLHWVLDVASLRDAPGWTDASAAPRGPAGLSGGSGDPHIPGIPGGPDDSGGPDDADGPGEPTPAGLQGAGVTR